jgi:hypothetical protein
MRVLPLAGFSGRAGIVYYLHYRFLISVTNEYNGTSVVFAAVLRLLRDLFQWFPTFWTINRERPINHVQIPSWITREDDVKVLLIPNSDGSSVSCALLE